VAPASVNPPTVASIVATVTGTATSTPWHFRCRHPQAAIRLVRPPDWLLERRKRAETPLTSVVATCYLFGVSTRRMENLVESLGITSSSKSQVSVMAKDLGAQGRAVSQPTTRCRPVHVRRRRRPRSQGVGERAGGDVHTLVAVGVNTEGYREILGVDVTSSEDEVTMPSPLVDDRIRLCGADTRRHQQTPSASAVLTSFLP